MQRKNLWFSLLLAVFMILGILAPVSAQDLPAGVDANKQYQINYRAHVSNIGWMDYVGSPNEAGTTGRALTLEAVEVQPSGVSLSVQPHVATIGWMDPVSNGVAGTVGQAKPLEAVKITVNGTNANTYDVYYQAHVSNIGWMGWVKNSEIGGTIGQSRQMEALEISLIPKQSDVSTAVEPGLKTVKNFLATALLSVGQTNYIWGF